MTLIKRSYAGRETATEFEKFVKIAVQINNNGEKFKATQNMKERRMTLNKRSYAGRETATEFEKFVKIAVQINNNGE